MNLQNTDEFPTADQEILKPLDEVIGIYYYELKRRIFPKNSKYKYFVYFLHFIHILFTILFVYVSLALPPKLQIYVVLWYIVVMSSWLIFGDCWFTILTNHIGGVKNLQLFPINIRKLYTIILVLTTISLLYYLFPKLSLFNFLMYMDKISKNLPPK